MIIFLDLDGVIINWARGVCDWFKIPYQPEKITHWNAMPELTNTEPHIFWDSINTPKFWEHLDLYPNAIDFIEKLRSIAPVVLFTSPAHNAAGYRQNWIEKYLPEMFYDNLYILTPAKWSCAYPNRILIDDHHINCKEFIQFGGKAILYPQPWNDAGKQLAVENLSEKEKNALVIKKLLTIIK
ncbi:MAG: hypothetical protein SVO01_00735 [Thermotogota bacterium]|nr:hypothetical protein [Thermotogota bacterium]